MVEIALKMYELVASIRFDGRTLSEKRGTLLQDFKDADAKSYDTTSRQTAFDRMYYVESRQM
jgi:hypothetical protein